MLNMKTEVEIPTTETITKNDATQQDEEKRGKSTIQFPYLTLDDAVAIAKAVHKVGGPHCQIDQLAAHLQQKADSSMFRLRLGTAKMFGLVTYGQGNVTLTSLGTRLSDPEQEQAARVEAFLSIPLYKRVYEQFKGVNLPPMSGLETAIANMGVAPKQKSNARQVFQRSATQAGFFAFGPTRLVYPPIKAAAVPAVGEPQHHSADVEKAPEKSKNDGNSGGGGDGGDGGNSQHPLIEGLIKTLKKLPAEDKPWPIEARKKWLQTAANIFDLVYSGEDGSSLRIEIQKDSAKQ